MHGDNFTQPEPERAEAILEAHEAMLLPVYTRCRTCAKSTAKKTIFLTRSLVMARFEDLPRAKQRLNLLRRLNRQRREIEQYLTDLEYWNELQKQRGQPGLPRDAEMVAMLAKCDREIQHIRNSK